MKIGLDTSVVLRLLTGSPEAQLQLARRALEDALAAGDEVLVTDLVLAESYHGLVAHYAVPKREARRMLAELLRSGVVSAEPGSAALAAFEANRGPGPVDRMIQGRHASEGAVTWTFDERMGRLPNAGPPRPTA